MKIKVGTKLLLSYLGILLTIFIITVYGFNVIVTQSMRNQAYDQLKKQSEGILRFIYDDSSFGQGILSPFRKEAINLSKLQIAGYLIDTDFVMLDDSYNILYQSVNQLSPNEIVLLLNEDRYYANYMKLTTIVENNLKQPLGYLILFTRIDQIDQLRNSFLSTLLFSFLMSGIVALIIALVMKRNILRPLRTLEKQMITISKNTKQELQPVLTGDEFEELYKVFKNMVNQLNVNEETRRRFFQNASHELKTPLMSIQGYAEAIKDGVLDEEDRDSGLNIIISQSQKLKRIVEEMIYLTNLEVDTIPFEFKTIPIVYTMEEAILGVKQLAHHEAIDIHWRNKDENLYVLQDEEKMVRVFTNILGNALRYAKTKIDIEIEAVNLRYVVIRIEDDGIGLKEGEEIKIFERFYKGEKGGTGLGLAISQSIIEAHKGSVKAYNNEQGGATFEVTLPLTTP